MSKDKGNFRITKSGNIEYRVSYYDATGKRRVKSFTGKSKDECKDRAYEFLRKNETKQIDIKPNSSIVDIAKQKIENDYIKNYCSEPGYDRHLQTLAIIEKGSIGTIPIKDVTEEMLFDYLNSITTYSPSVIRKIFAMIASAFDLAYEKKIIKSNYILTKQIKCPKSINGEKKVRGMTEEEQVKFVNTLNESEINGKCITYRLQLLIELYSGMRMGEINALRPECINFHKGFIHVDKTISRGKARPFLKEGTKTKAGERDIPISAPLKPLLEEALAQMRDNPDNLIFYDHFKDGVITTSQVCSMYKKICKDAGIPYYGQHALRHTFATRCIEAGIQPVVLKGWLGHTNIHITLDTYADVFDRMNLGVISKFEEYMDAVMKEE